MKLKASQAQPQAPTPLVDLSDMATLSNALLRRAHRAGMPVTLLAFPDEQDLLTKIADGAPKLPYAEIVRVRHNLCHGNILEHIITASDGMGGSQSGYSHLNVCVIWRRRCRQSRKYGLQACINIGVITIYLCLENS
uniref:hypothetical protein n=1 Tax=Escherichia coli TaxID=562 RepID=UPI001F2F32AC|nr:hypothetical protein [Escherichia coli]